MTSFIDVNAQNSRIEKETNNVYTYELPEPLELPAGTAISVQNSLVNLQGITGASIEIPEDIEETIHFQYYVSDSTYQAPNKSISGDLANIVEFNIYSRMDEHNNADAEFGPGKLAADAHETTGFTENIMPLVSVCNELIVDPGGATVATNLTVPFCGKADIKIVKGIYSIAEISKSISDQINLVTNPDNQNNTITENKLERKFQGLLYNNTTNRSIHTPEPTYWDTYRSTGVPPQPLIDINGLRVLNYDDDYFPYDVMAITNKKNNDLFNDLLAGNLNNQDPSVNFDQMFRFNAYNMVFSRINGNIGPNFFDPKVYNIFSKSATGVGTSGFNVTFQNSFAIQNCHEPRRLPTHDRFGNVVKNSGQACAYSKRLAGDAETGLNDSDVSTLNTIVQRYSGILIYNWGYKTCLKLGKDFSKTMNNNPQLANNVNQFAAFSEFFPNETEAKKAWATTLWAKLGFAYEDIQAPSCWENFINFDNPVEKAHGFTTRQEVDSSAVPFVSTLFNGAQGGVGTSEAPKAQGDQIEPLPQSIASIQLFNLMDSNVPNNIFNNNKKLGGGVACVAPYQSSFYTSAVMIPIQTKGFDIQASALPILSDTGYLLILSNLVDQNDIVKYKSNVGLLDQLPKSNLSNQDFISDRNPLVHVLSNTKILNSIRIEIYNPDLTDVTLRPNSSVLLRIEKPTPKSTILEANVNEEAAEQTLLSEKLDALQKAQKQLAKKNKKK